MKGPNTNCKKEGCTVVIKRKSPQCELQIVDTKIKQIQKYKYLGSGLTDDGKYDIEVRRHIGIAKNASQKLSKVLNDRKIL